MFEPSLSNGAGAQTWLELKRGWNLCLSWQVVDPEVEAFASGGSQLVRRRSVGWFVTVAADCALAAVAFVAASGDAFVKLAAHFKCQSCRPLSDLSVLPICSEILSAAAKSIPDLVLPGMGRRTQGKMKICLSSAQPRGRRSSKNACWKREAFNQSRHIQPFSLTCHEQSARNVRAIPYEHLEDKSPTQALRALQCMR